MSQPRPPPSYAFMSCPTGSSFAQKWKSRLPLLSPAMTQRLYYQDCYLREFRARVLNTSEDGRRVYLDRTAFYTASGGQPFDTGTLGGASVLDVVDEQERVAHVV